ncbi:MAG: hypothetical protein PWP07_125 [Epulopiscium sp.]|nr:hypothetical protein [Candidatus Epulonipiscium sp.]
MIRRKLAALLAGAMILTSLPMVSFARTNNGVDRVPVVKDDHTFTISDAPFLRIKEDPDKLAGQKFVLKFENAEWKGPDDYEEHDAVNAAGYTLVEGVTKYTYRKLTSKSVEIVVGDVTDSDSDQDQVIYIPMLAEMGDAGEAKVTVDPVDSKVSAGTYVFAVAGSGDTITSIEKVETITSGDSIKPIVITESKIGVFGAGKNQKIELRLPNNFEWDDLKNAKVTFSGGLKDAADPSSPSLTYKNSDGKIAVLNVSFDGGRTERGSIIISGLKIKANNKAKYGDVTVKVSGEDVTSETITVAKYVDYKSTVKADGDPKELYAGRYEGVGDGNKFDFDDAHKLQKLIIEEDVKNSWLSERTTTIEFPSWVRILGYEINKEDNISTTLAKNDDGNKYDAVVEGNADENEVSFTANPTPAGTTGKRKLEITFYVSVEGDARGDITATVSGRSLGEEYEVVLGKAVAPVEVEVDPVEVRIGRQNEALGDIVITEAKAEAIKEGDLVIELPKDFEWSNTPDVKVTEGDLEIDSKNVKVKDQSLTIPVKTDSREASTITISNAKVDLDRTVPEGSFKFEVKGSAVIENGEDESGVDKVGKFRTDYIAEVEFAKVVTPNPEDLATGKATAQKVAFTVGSTQYTVGKETVTADVAPYIKDGRTMLPVKYVAYALGIDPSNIKWDQATKTVTILGDRVVQVKIGSKDLVVNGAVLTMDTAAEVKDGRTFLPISWLASALNVPYSWDDATKTVTFN